MEGQEKGQGLKMNGLHHTLVYKYTENVNLLGDDITTVTNNTGVLLLASKETALELNAERLSCHQNEGKNITQQRQQVNPFKTWKSQKRVKILVKKDLQDNNYGMSFTTQFIIRCLPVCYLQMQTFKKTKTTTVHVVLDGCKTLSLKLWDEHKGRVFKNTA